jgi:hypothetical protein
LLTVGSLVQWIFRRGMGKREYALWLPVYCSSRPTRSSIRCRSACVHVVAVYPLLFVLISGRVAAMVGRQWSATRERLLAGTAAVLLAWHMIGTIAVAPRYLQFFNEIAGGPSGGHRWLIDSNIDWGQDLIRLRDYMQREKIDTINLAYFGRVNPLVYGIHFRPLEQGYSHGITAVSATFLMGRPYFWYLGGRMRWVHANTYSWLQSREPIARVGAMFIYNLE